MTIYEILHKVLHQKQKDDEWDKAHGIEHDENDLSKPADLFNLYVDTDGEGYCVQVEGIEIDYSNEAIVLHLAQ